RVDRVDLLGPGPVAPETHARPAPRGVVLRRAVAGELQRRARIAEGDHVDLPAGADLGDDGDLLAVRRPGDPAPPGHLVGDHPGCSGAVRVRDPQFVDGARGPGEGDALPVRRPPGQDVALVRVIEDG